MWLIPINADRLYAATRLEAVLKGRTLTMKLRHTVLESNGSEILIFFQFGAFGAENRVDMYTQEEPYSNLNSNLNLCRDAEIMSGSRYGRKYGFWIYSG